VAIPIESVQHQLGRGSTSPSTVGRLAIISNFDASYCTGMICGIMYSHSAVETNFATTENICRKQQCFTVSYDVPWIPFVFIFMFLLLLLRKEREKEKKRRLFPSRTQSISSSNQQQQLPYRCGRKFLGCMWIELWPKNCDNSDNNPVRDETPRKKKKKLRRRPFFLSFLSFFLDCPSPNRQVVNR